jgi:hypothetical protein
MFLFNKRQINYNNKITCHLVEFSVKAGQHGTCNVSLVQNRVRFKKNL